MKKLLLKSALIAGACLLLNPAFAHSDDYLNTVKAPHGGQLRMAGVYHFELELTKNSPQEQDNPVVVHVTDHAGNKLSTAGATGMVIFKGGSITTITALVPQGENSLVGLASYASTPRLVGVVTVQMEGKHAEEATFTPFASTAAPKMDHSKH